MGLLIGFGLYYLIGGGLILYLCVKGIDMMSRWYAKRGKRFPTDEEWANRMP